MVKQKATASSKKKASPVAKVTLALKPQAVVKRLLSAIPERARDVLTRRYGLGAQAERMTLESIGQMYGITRERVRQIENYALSAIRKSDAYKKEQPAFDELEAFVVALGKILPERELLEKSARDEMTQNHIHFLLVLGQPFTKVREDDDFLHHWFVDDVWAKKIKTALHTLYENFTDDALVPESEMIDMFLEHIRDLSEQYKNEEILKRWLSLSKRIGRNPLGEWGKSTSSNVSLKGVRDYAYLVIRQHGSPMHFTEVAKKIAELFEKEAHIATTHNELIKDSRFVLVGRGLYALKEWGYSTGVVKDVIRDVLKTNGSLTREEIIDRVLKERYVKPNTVLVNLQDTKQFKRLADGRYTLVA